VRDLEGRIDGGALRVFHDAFVFAIDIREKTIPNHHMVRKEEEHGRKKRVRKEVRKEARGEEGRREEGERNEGR